MSSCSSCDCNSITGRPATDTSLSQLAVTNKLSTCKLSAQTITATTGNFGSITVNGEPLVAMGGAIGGFDYNQFQAISILPPNHFAVIELASNEADIRIPANPLLNPEWFIQGVDTRILSLSPLGSIPNPRPFLQWNNVFVPCSGDYEFHLSARDIAFEGVWAGSVDGIISTASKDFSTPYVGDPNLRFRAVVPVGFISKGIHDIGFVNVANGSGGGFGIVMTGYFRLVQISGTSCQC